MTTTTDDRTTDYTEHDFDDLFEQAESVEPEETDEDDITDPDTPIDESFLDELADEFLASK